MRRLAPREAALAVDALTERLIPREPIVRVQRVWSDAVGAAVASECEPIAESRGTVTVRCSSAVWAQELDLLAPELIERLNEALDEPLVKGLRCRATGSRKWPGDTV